MSFFNSEDNNHSDSVTEGGFDPYAVVVSYSISANGINVNYEDERKDPRFVEVNISTEDPKYNRAFDFLAEKLRDQEPVTLAEWEFVLSRHDQLNGNITKITENIAILADGTVTHDYDTRKDALHAYIGELVAEKNPMAKAFARFAERLEANPSEASKDQVFDWFIGLTRQGERMSITNDGKLVAYKGVKVINDVPFSIFQGPGIIENPSGETEFIKHDSLPNRVGSTVSVQRSYVTADPSIGCGPGLHAGTYSYARGWGNGNVLQVEIDPAHIVSIPTCSGFQKLRCHRYVVVGFISDPITAGVVADHDYSWDVEDFEKWVEAGHSIGLAKGFVERGIDIVDALEMQEMGGFTVEMDLFLEEGFSDLEALRFVRNGISLEEALGELEDDYNDYVLLVHRPELDDDDEREVESTEQDGAEPEWKWEITKDSEKVVEDSAKATSKNHKKKNRKRRKKNKR